MTDPLAQHTPTRRLTLILAAALCLLSLATFYRVVHASFVPFDDDIEIVSNPHIQDGLSAANLSWMFTDTRQTERYTPLSWLVWIILYQCFGMNPSAFHAEALIVHTVNTILVFILLRSIFRRLFARSPPNVIVICAALAAAFWCVHPLRVEVVAWVTQVRFAEATTFLIAAVLLYFKAVDRSPSAPVRTPCFWYAVSVFAISLLFYPTGIGLILILPLLDILPLRRIDVAKSSWRDFLRLFLEKVPFYIPAIFVGVMAVYGRFGLSGVFKAPVALGQFGLGHRIMQVAYMFMRYVWKPLDPTHISPIYTVLMHVEPLQMPFLLSLLALLLISIAAISLWRRAPAFAVLWFSHVALILPVGGYFEYPYYPSDRYSYMQGILWSVVIGSFLLYLWVNTRQTVRMALVGIAVLVIAGFAALSNVQAGMWKNGETLFQQILVELGDDPYVADIHSRLGDYYRKQGRWQEAENEIAAALQSSPNYPLAHHDQGLFLINLAENARNAGRPTAQVRSLYRRAADEFNQEVTVNGSISGMNMAGYAYAHAGELDLAQTALQLAIRLMPTYGQAHLTLGETYFLAGKRAEGLEQLDQGMRLAPELVHNRAAVIAEWDALAAQQNAPAAASTRTITNPATQP